MIYRLNQESIWLIVLYHMGYEISKIQLGQYLLNSENLFLKIAMFSGFPNFWHSLFHSIIEKTKKKL